MKNKMSRGNQANNPISDNRVLVINRYNAGCGDFCFPTYCQHIGKTRNCYIFNKYNNRRLPIRNK